MLDVVGRSLEEAVEDRDLAGAFAQNTSALAEPTRLAPPTMRKAPALDGEGGLGGRFGLLGHRGVYLGSSEGLSPHYRHRPPLEDNI